EGRKEAESRKKDDDDILLSQVPAAFGFGIRGEKIIAYPQSGGEYHPELLEQILPLLLEKAKAYDCKIRAHGNSPENVRSNASNIVEAIESWAETPKPGVLLMRLRSLEADISAYDTLAGRDELYPHAIAAMLDLKSSIDDFLGMDPFVQKIQANAMALEIQGKNASKINLWLVKIEKIASESVFVDSSVEQALAEGKTSVEADEQIVRSSNDHKKTSEAIERQANQTALRVMTTRNFVARIIRSIQDGIVGGTEAGVKGAVSGGIRTGFAVLVGSIAGPFAGVAMFVASVRPIAEKASEISKLETDDADETE
ncbi:hypothetical protein MNBD_ALPHA12-1476, partial [hydrothermal vent metagenome]